MSLVVNEVLKQQIFDSLGLVDYRLRIDRQLGIATVDLQASGNSRQKLQNLSSCQMLGLFGGVRQTLTSYAPRANQNCAFYRAWEGHFEHG
jgi:hypothetical protein